MICDWIYFQTKCLYIDCMKKKRQKKTNNNEKTIKQHENQSLNDRIPIKISAETYLVRYTRKLMLYNMVKK